MTPCREEWCQRIELHAEHRARAVKLRTPSDTTRQAAAKRIGVTLAEYDAHHASGEKWCKPCGAWHPVEMFALDTKRWDGLKPWCTEVYRRRAAEYYERLKRAAGE